MDQEQGEYLPTPPPSVEAGPNCPPPAANPNCTWTPGYWKWCVECESGKYVWCPGTWMEHQPDWVWTPPRYLPTPGGCLFVKGYWDYPLELRGVMYAPVYFTEPCFTRPDYVYCPSVCIPATTLTSCLFVQPSCQHYRFGDYFDSKCSAAGIYPWYAYHHSRWGCDPIYSHASAVHHGDRQWSHRIYEEYCYRRDNPQARPPALFKDQHAYTESAIRSVQSPQVGRLAPQFDGRNALPQKFVKVNRREPCGDGRAGKTLAKGLAATSYRGERGREKSRANQDATSKREIAPVSDRIENPTIRPCECRRRGECRRDRRRAGAAGPLITSAPRGMPA